MEKFIANVINELKPEYFKKIKVAAALMRNYYERFRFTFTDDTICEVDFFSDEFFSIARVEHGGVHIKADIKFDINESPRKIANEIYYNAVSKVMRECWK